MQVPPQGRGRSGTSSFDMVLKRSHSHDDYLDEGGTLRHGRPARRDGPADSRPRSGSLDILARRPLPKPYVIEHCETIWIVVGNLALTLAIVLSWGNV